MQIRFDPQKVFDTRWYQYAIRFLLGGLVTAIAGVITHDWGPGVGGLFLAFPAIFPASVTLIEKHERERKELIGKSGTIQGRDAAAADAAGAAIGAIGLLVFSIIAWKLLPEFHPAAVLTLATGGWMTVSATIWRLREAL